MRAVIPSSWLEAAFGGFAKRSPGEQAGGIEYRKR